MIKAMARGDDGTKQCDPILARLKRGDFRLELPKKTGELSPEQAFSLLRGPGRGTYKR